MITFKDYLSEAKDPTAKVIAKLEDLNRKINRWAHKWDHNHQPIRMVDWIDEYNDIKASNRPAWEAYCKKNGMTTGHNGYDCLA